MRIEDKKIMFLRKAHKVRLLDLAEAIGVSASFVYSVENRKSQYSDKMLERAKDFFNIKDMPLSQFEYDTAKIRLYVMLDYIRDSRFDEARAIIKEMTNIVNLDPCDNELPMLYRLFEVAFLLAIRDIDTAEEKLNYLHSRLDDMNDEHRCYFYSNMGQLNIFRVHYMDALGFYKQALELSKNIADFLLYEITRLHHLVGMCYSYLELPNIAIYYMQKNRELYNVRNRDRFRLSSDLLLALNFIKVNNLSDAENFLNDCLVRAMSIQDNNHTGVARHYLGYLNMKTENWQIAIEHFDKALECHEKGSTSYLAVLHRKILCLTKSRKFSNAKKLLEETRPLHCDDGIFSIYFEALGHYITISSRISIYNDESAEYIETVAIPYFKKACSYFLAVDYCMLLESYFEIKNNKKALLMSQAIREIYERCLFYQ